MNENDKVTPSDITENKPNIKKIHMYIDNRAIFERNSNSEEDPTPYVIATNPSSLDVSEKITWDAGTYYSTLENAKNALITWDAGTYYSTLENTKNALIKQADELLNQIESQIESLLDTQRESMFEFNIVSEDNTINEFEHTKYVYAETLPLGWTWEINEDGSGCLLSPEKESYFEYDLETNEVIKGRSDTNKYSTVYPDYSLYVEGEKWVNENVINNSTETIETEGLFMSNANEQSM